MRPSSIVRFGQVYLGSMALAFINGLLNWSTAKEKVASDPNLAEMGETFLIVTMVLSYAIYILLWFFVARKASTVAKWIVAVLFGIGLITLPFSFESLPLLNMSISAIAMLLHGIAVYLLFRPDAKEWFETKGQMNNPEKTFG